MSVMSVRLVLVCLTLLALAGCGGGDSTMAARTSHFGALEFRLTTPKTVYARAEQVPLTFTVKNRGDRTVNVGIVGCFIYWGVWQGDHGVGPGFGCADEVYTIPIAPGETKTYDSTWDQTDINVNHVPSGQYTLKAWLPASSIDGAPFSFAQQQQILGAIPAEITIQ